MCDRLKFQLEQALEALNLAKEQVVLKEESADKSQVTNLFKI